MPNSPRKIAFITASTDHGMLIVNRFDQHIVEGRGYGVGFQLLDKAAYDPDEVNLLLSLLELRRELYGDGVIAVDCGANVGVLTIECAKRMTGWGVVVAIEAQERIYYALAGNIAINNCFNARAIHAAVTSQPGMMKIPNPNYLAAGSFGSLELRQRDGTEFIGQAVDYAENRMVEVRAITLDSFNFPRLDLIKLDLEGMELDALQGGIKYIGAHRPILLVEMVKSDEAKLRAWLEQMGYSVLTSGMNFLAIHNTDKCLSHVSTVPVPPSAVAAS